jgi:magnesium/cobalt transport protein CorA
VKEGGAMSVTRRKVDGARGRGASGADISDAMADTKLAEAAAPAPGPAPSAAEDERHDVSVAWLSAGGVEEFAVEDLPALLAREDGFVWVDMPACDARAARVLAEVFAVHPLAVRDCSERNFVPKVHPYVDHLFIVLHSPEPSTDEHVHLLELDQFVGRRYLVTVHGPLGEGVVRDLALRETRAVRARLETGRFRPGSPFELSYAIVSGITHRMEVLVWALAGKIGALERHVMQARAQDTHEFVEEMFRLRHELITIQTMAAQSRLIYARMAALTRSVPAEAMPFIVDLQDQYDRVKSLCDGEEKFLDGVVTFYQTNIADQLNRFVKRLTALGTILVFCTLVAGIYGMNFAHMPELDWVLGYPLALGMMALSAVVFAWWFHRKGWL